MKILTLVLAILALFSDAWTTYLGLLDGHSERTPLRRFLIRALGMIGGTFGFAAVASLVVVLVNIYSKQPTWGLVFGNLVIVGGFGWAAWHNLRVSR